MPTETIQLIGPTFPPGYCPTSWQALADLLIGGAALSFPTGYTQIILQSSSPNPEDRGKIWFKTIDDNLNKVAIGIFTWSSASSAWVEYNPRHVIACANGAATANVDVLTTVTSTPAAIVSGQFFSWVHLVENTGPVTVTINGGAGIQLFDWKGQSIAATELPANAACFAYYDGTKLQLLSPTRPVITTLTASTIVDTVPAPGAARQISIPASTAHFQVFLKCLVAENGITVGDEIEIYCFGLWTGEDDPIFNEFSLTRAGNVLHVARIATGVSGAGKSYVTPKSGEDMVLGNEIGSFVRLTAANWQLVVKLIS